MLTHHSHYHFNSVIAMFLYRHCLWILGNGTTLLASNSIWADLVRDSKRRGCFFDAFVDKDLAEAVMLVTKPEPWKQIEQVFRNLNPLIFFCETKSSIYPVC